MERMPAVGKARPLEGLGALRHSCPPVFGATVAPIGGALADSELWLVPGTSTPVP